MEVEKDGFKRYKRLREISKAANLIGLTRSEQVSITITFDFMSSINLEVYVGR